VILFLARILPDPSVAPKDIPPGAATEPVPLSGTAVTVHHPLFIETANVIQLQNNTFVNLHFVTL